MYEQLNKQKLQNKSVEKSSNKNTGSYLNNITNIQDIIGNQGTIQLLNELGKNNNENQFFESVSSLPNNIKNETESMTGIALDDVKVHYNSEKPYTIGALAYTQGNEIYIAPNQERYLKHELWHVIQQKQGRVKPTNYEYSVPINDDLSLEKEAQEYLFDRKKTTYKTEKPVSIQTHSEVIQRVLPSIGLLRFSNGRRLQAEEQGPQQQLVNIGVDLDENGVIGVYNNPNYTEFLNTLKAWLTVFFDNLENANIPQNPTVSHQQGNFPQFIQDGFDAFNRFTNFHLQNGAPLPEVNVDRNLISIGAYLQEGNVININGINAVGGEMNVGIGCGFTQVSHELGHHLENNLNLLDFSTIHNFLRGRTRNNGNGGERKTGQALREINRHDGYDAVLPEMNFMNPLSRFLFDRSNVISSYLYNGFNILNQNNIRDYFYQTQGSRNVSYATTMYGQDYGTEFISTTVELLVDSVGRERLINTDPLRVVLFLYVANRPAYVNLRQQMQQINVQDGINDLNELIHIVDH